MIGRQASPSSPATCVPFLDGPQGEHKEVTGGPLGDRSSGVGGAPAWPGQRMRGGSKGFGLTSCSGGLFGQQMALCSLVCDPRGSVQSPQKPVHTEHAHSNPAHLH